MITNKNRTLRDTIIIVVSSLLFVHLLFRILPGVFVTWNAQATDQLFVLRSSWFPSRIPYDSTVIHVDETDSTIQTLTGSYLARHHYAQVIRNLGEVNAAAQIWDYIFRAPSTPEEDSILINACRSSHNAYFGLAFGLKDEPMRKPPPRPRSYWTYLDSTKWRVQVDGDIREMYYATSPILTFPEMARAARGLGYLSLQFDADGVFRRAPLLVKYADAFYPSFPFRAICDYLDVTPDRIVLRPGSSVTLQGAHRPGQAPHDIVIPVDAKCCMIVNFVGPWNRMVHYDFAAIYQMSDDRDMMEYDWKPRLEGKLIVAAEASTGATDIKPVPTDNNFPLSGLHANVMHTILTENFLHDVNGWRMLLIEAILLGVVGYFSMRLSSSQLWIGGLGLLVGYVVVVVVAFLYANLILNFARPVFMIGLSVSAVLSYRYINEEKAKEAFRRSFESYLPPSVVNRLVAHPESVFDGQKKELTIMFTDIKSFTTYSSTMTPDTIQDMLAEYFGAMVDIVFKYEGTVDKYIGDGLMVFFGAPEPQADHAVRAVKAGIEMQRKCRELKEKWEQSGLFPLKIRIGINTGEVVVGNMGTAKKLSYTVLGAPVNLANRLESNAPVEGIMISARTYELVQGLVPTRPLEAVKVKGLDQPIRVYEVLVDDKIHPA